MSGKLSTSLTNTILNETMLHYAFRRQGLVYQSDYDFLVEGDDNIVFAHSTTHIETAIGLIKQLGFDTKSDYYHSI